MSVHKYIDEALGLVCVKRRLTEGHGGPLTIAQMYAVFILWAVPAENGSL